MSSRAVLACCVGAATQAARVTQENDAVLQMLENEGNSASERNTWCNPFSSHSQKYYNFELDVPTFEHPVTMQMNRKRDSVTLHVREGEWWGWLPKDVEYPHAHDLLQNVHYESPLEVKIDLVNDVRYFRRTRGDGTDPGHLEIQYLNGMVTKFAGGVWYPPHETLTGAKIQLKEGTPGVHRRVLTRQLDGLDLDDVTMLGTRIKNMSLASVSLTASEAFVLGTVHELIGAATEAGVNVSPLPELAFNITLVATFAKHLNKLTYPASDKWFDKLWCHPLFKRCKAKGVIVPRHMTCPPYNGAREMLAPGSDGPSDFILVSDRSGCEGDSATQIRRSSRELMQDVMKADARDRKSVV